jgi:glucose-6-phosphate 1-dehydrogenase
MDYSDGMPLLVIRSHKVKHTPKCLKKGENHYYNRTPVTFVQNRLNDNQAKNGINDASEALNANDEVVFRQIPPVCFAEFTKCLQKPRVVRGIGKLLVKKPRYQTIQMDKKTYPKPNEQ